MRSTACQQVGAGEVDCQGAPAGQCHRTGRGSRKAERSMPSRSSRWRERAGWLTELVWARARCFKLHPRAIRIRKLTTILEEVDAVFKQRTEAVASATAHSTLK